MSSKISIEKILIPLNYKRNFQINTALLRFLIVAFYIIVLLYTIVFISGDHGLTTYWFSIPLAPFEVVRTESELEFYKALISQYFTLLILLYYFYWTVLRVMLWIYDRI